MTANTNGTPSLKLIIQYVFGVDLLLMKKLGGGLTNDADLP